VIKWVSFVINHNRLATERISKISYVMIHNQTATAAMNINNKQSKPAENMPSFSGDLYLEQSQPSSDQKR